MRMFLAALLVFGLAVAATAFGYGTIQRNATDAYSTESARVGHRAPPDGRLGWAAEAGD